MIIVLMRPRKPTNSLVIGRIRSFCLAGVLGLEPRLTEPESVGLPITLYPTGLAESPQPPGHEDKPYCKPHLPPNRFGTCAIPPRSAAQLRATRVPSFISRDNPYAKTAKSAKPPTSNAASTQPIPLIALSAAIEVVRPATRYANTLLIT
jgi:hypothetical protein